ncbi:MAG: hypothetical protein QOD00_2122 [Blastocatellia bacterium]|jgi:hypothetical protein|nr:hypothetical protein [Blastocatellia bacterium]
MSTREIHQSTSAPSQSTPATQSIVKNNLEENFSADKFITDNSPNARKMINSMRHLGYSTYSAIKDILDNSNDAEATWVKCYIQKDSRGEFTYTIADNGVGMDWHTLDEALKLGSETERNIVSDLGKFGMGLVTASLSIGKRVEVITKQTDGPILHSIQDVDEVIRQDKFVKFLQEADEQAQLQFNKMLAGEDSGTIVRLTHCDHISNKDMRSFTTKLRREIGQTYRFFLSSGQIKMFVNDEEIIPIDPLMLEEGSEIQSDEQYTIKFTDEHGTEHSDTIRVRVVLLPDYGQEGNKNRGINIPNQGIYLLRNYREIAEGEMLGLMTKHNDLNRVRAEVFFPATLDEMLGVDFTKQRPEPKQAALDKLREVLVPQFKNLTKRIKSQRVKVEDIDVPHDEAARLIGQKAHLLAKPKLQAENRKPPTHKAREHTEDHGSTKTRKNFKNTQNKPVSLPCRFEAASMTVAGPIWDAEPEGKTLVITWNVDHPFYQRFILDNKDNPSMVSATDFLVYSLAAAELVYRPDDNEEIYEDRCAMMENIRSTVSSNMRQLLS